MSKKPASSTSRMYAQRMADGLRHTKLYHSYLTARAVRPCQREAAGGRQSHVASLGRVQMQHRHRRVFRALLMQHADAGALCAVLFLLQTRAVSEKSDGALGSGACDRASRTPHSTPTHMASIGILRMTSVEHRAHTRSSSSNNSSRTRTRSPSERSLPFLSTTFVCSYFSIS